ncbi:serine/threonine-protein kinase [Kitasatospora sp. DSM 101779]|uniref:serine/threonine-protein kinase n=1 Tax=Kitasatospora sp. DSM 101779 TaxID=2853165 RepID=UPI0021D9EBD1|nr:serine/threonine-protein kinase [Kitasatospora sp. DSM 101779]MCU7820723.1 serine/threonine protein kinase [Kitasatospora sp. DSM 101779]
MQGERLDGRYRLETVLGTGGMGQVWRAYDERVGRPVAVKLLTGADSSSSGVERFAAEARAAGNLSSPHIVTVHDFGRAGPEHGGAPFLVMEHLDGRALEDVLDEGPLPAVPDALGWTQQVCTGLAAAHRAGLVHRDIKPANAMLLPGGTVKILDFGIVKHLYENHSFTGTGTAMGTAAYMSPEQARGDRGIGPAADLYAVGCLLHALLTGRPPFTGAPLAVLHQHLTRQPEAPSGVRPGVPAGVDALVLALLAKDPGERPGSAEQVAEHIGALLTAPAPAQAGPSTTAPQAGAHPSGPLDGSPTRGDAPGVRTTGAGGTTGGAATAGPAGTTDPRSAPPPAPGADPHPHPALPGDAPAEPGRPMTARASALRRSALAGSAAVAVQLVAFDSWTPWAAALAGVGAFLVVAALLWIDKPSPQLDRGTGGLFAAVAVTLVSGVLLLFSSKTAWWVALVLTVAMCPVVLVLQKPLARGLGRLFGRHEAEAQMAVSAALVNAAFATGFYVEAAGLGILKANGLGLLTWCGLAAVLTPLLPGRAAGPEPAPEALNTPA